MFFNPFGWMAGDLGARIISWNVTGRESGWRSWFGW